MAEFKLDDLSSRGASVFILIFLDFLFLAATILAYMKNWPADLRTTLVTWCAGWNGALAIALNSKSSATPANSTSVTTTIDSTEPPPAVTPLVAPVVAPVLETSPMAPVAPVTGA